MNKLIFILIGINLTGACSSAFRPLQRTFVTLDCEGLNRWTKKLNNYPYKMATRTLKFKIEAEVLESPDRIRRYSGAIPLQGRVVYIKSDFIRLKNKNIIGTTTMTSKGPLYKIKFDDKSGPLDIFIAPKNHYGYYEWGESKYALICDLDPLRED